MAEIINIVGSSGSGKTALIVRFIELAKTRGLITGVIKHAAGGFNLDIKGKDSARFTGAGANSVTLIGRGKSVIFVNSSDDIESVLEFHRSRCDLIFIEGFKEEPDFKKILVIRPDENLPEELPSGTIAIVCDGNEDRKISVPIFNREDIDNLFDFIIGEVTNNEG